mmetsp:Transcript_38260/g.57693  ORF Transcript_38260/g.57693 Transcript_38260/m.57693 type:complete len:87 (-) Transcript_38260:307-567(-)
MQQATTTSASHNCRKTDVRIHVKWTCDGITSQTGSTEMSDLQKADTCADQAAGGVEEAAAASGDSLAAATAAAGSANAGAFSVPTM